MNDNEILTRIFSELLTAKAKADVAIQEIAQIKAQLNNTSLEQELSTLSQKIELAFEKIKDSALNF